MAYYAPPGGSLTARVARELQESGMHGILPSVNVRTPRAIPAAIGAARRMRFNRPPDETTMTGMGIVTPPATHARRFAVPAPVMFAVTQTAARIAAQRGMSLMGLGAAAARRPIGVRPFVSQAFPAAAGVQRQAAMYMSPGGGYSQIPGFMPAIGPPMKRIAFLAWLGQDQVPIETTTIPAPDVLTPPADIFVPGPITGLLPSIPPVTTPIPTTMIPAPTVLKLPSTGTPLAVQNVPLPNFTPGQITMPLLPSVQPSFMNVSTLGVPNKYLIAGAFAVVIITGMVGRRRRNPHRRRNRAR